MKSSLFYIPKYKKRCPCGASFNRSIRKLFFNTPLFTKGAVNSNLWYCTSKVSKSFCHSILTMGKLKNYEICYKQRVYCTIPKKILTQTHILKVLDSLLDWRHLEFSFLLQLNFNKTFSLTIICTYVENWMLFKLCIKNYFYQNNQNNVLSKSKKMLTIHPILCQMLLDILTFHSLS